MPVRDWRLRIEDIVDAVSKIERYTSGMDFTAFRADEKTLDAVVQNLEVIGEAAGHVPNDIAAQHPEVPWADMRAMRNVLAHEYFGVNPAILWDTVTRNLPPVKPHLQRILDTDATGS